MSSAVPPLPPANPTDVDQTPTVGQCVPSLLLRDEFFPQEPPTPHGVSHPSVLSLVMGLMDGSLALVSIATTYMLLKLWGGSSNLPNPLWFAVWMTPTIIASYLVGAYNPRTDFRSLRFAAEFMVSQLAAVVIGNGIAAVTFFYGWAMNPSRLWVFGWIFLFAPVAWYCRRLMAAMMATSRSLDVLIIGSAEEALRVQKIKNRLGERGQALCLSEVDARAADALTEVIAGASQNLESIVLGPQLVQPNPTLMQGLVTAHVQRIPVLTWEAYFQRHFKQIPLDSVNHEWLFAQDFQLAESSIYSGIKRLSDIVGGIVLLGALSPFLAAGVIGVWFSDPGPALFTQERIGWRGRPFTVWKLRSMRQEAEGGTTKVGDDRIFAWGKIIRRYRIDEIPQLWNIIRGDMSLIGPRPEWTKCVDEYERLIPMYHLRHTVKPGLTGWAQVNYPYGENTDDAIQKFAYDLYYIRRFSMMLDLSILIKTVFVTVFGHGGR